MVKGIDVFQEYFKEYADQYVLIGGTACSISFEEQDISFRATKDLDMVLIIEALTPAFGERFWQFIRDGGYQNRARSNGKPQFFRFDKPYDPHFPKMIELFSRTDWPFYLYLLSFILIFMFFSPPFLSTLTHFSFLFI